MTKISGFPEDTGPTTDDFVLGVDTGTSTTKKVKWLNAATLLFNNFPTGATGFGANVQTYTNANTAGGTYSYINLGGIKLFYGITPNLTPGANATTVFTVNFPTSFFSTVNFVSEQIILASASVSGNFIVGNSFDATNMSFYMTNTTASPTVGGRVGVIAIGT